MVQERKKVMVAMSGGVDSTMAAALLQRADFECEGVFMITCDHGRHAQKDAEAVAEKLGMKLHIIDLREDFERILDYFCGEYRRARTPNPCVVCNRVIKFGRLWEFAKERGCNFLATGHYAKVLKTEKGFGLYETANAVKDQSYVLTMIEKKVLEHVILPMGDYSKEQTKEMAKELALAVEGKSESQEICFVPDDDYVSVLEKRCPQLIRKGNIVDSAGNILGEHTGIHRFTIGQRRGLGVAMGTPYYVTGLDAETNTVTLGPKEEVMHRKLAAGGVNWLMDEPQEAFRAKVKVRYNSPGQSAMVIPGGEDVEVEFDEAVSAITPGQLAVFYVAEGKNSRVAGGGWIDKTMNDH